MCACVPHPAAGVCLAALQNGKAIAFGLLDECRRLAAAGRGGGGSRLVVALREGVQHVAALGAQGGVELTTSRRR